MIPWFLSHVVSNFGNPLVWMLEAGPAQMPYFLFLRPSLPPLTVCSYSTQPNTHSSFISPPLLCSVHGLPASPRGRSPLVPGFPGWSRLPRLPFHTVHSPQLQAHVHTWAVSVESLTSMDQRGRNNVNNVCKNDRERDLSFIPVIGISAMSCLDTFLCLLTPVLPSSHR